MPDKDSVPTWIKVAIGAILFFMGIWATAWGVGRNGSADSFLISSHETRLTSVEKDVDIMDNRMDATERVQITLQKDQQAILSNQVEMKSQLIRDSQERLKRDAIDSQIQRELIQKVGDYQDI